MNNLDEAIRALKALPNFCISGVSEMTVRDLEKLLEDTAKRVEELEERVAIMAEGNQGWHYFKLRKPTDEEREEYREEYGDEYAENLTIVEDVPGDGEEVLVWTKSGFCVDTYEDGMLECYGEIVSGMAWKHMDQPPKVGDEDG